MARQGFILKVGGTALNATTLTATDFGVTAALAADPGIAGTSLKFVITTDEVSNVQGQTPYDSLQLILRYENEIPGFGAVPQTWNLDARVEGKITVDGVEQWTTIAQQFEPFRRASQGPERRILLNPTTLVLDPGVDIYDDEGGDTVGRTSLTQGRLTTESWRVRFILIENDIAGAGSFQSIDLTGFGEMYNA